MPSTSTALTAFAAAGLISAAPFLFTAGPAFADGSTTTGTESAAEESTTSGNGSIGGGNQLGADADVPVNICGNAIAVLGNAGAYCADGGASASDSGSGSSTSGNGSVLGGNQGDVDVDLPVNACGNAIAVGGEAAADCESSEATDASSTSRPAPPESDEQHMEDPVQQSPSPSPQTEESARESVPAPTEESPSAGAASSDRSVGAASADAGLPVTGPGAMALIAAGATALIGGFGALLLGRGKARP